jgi:hypothetical protein
LNNPADTAIRINRNADKIAHFRLKTRSPFGFILHEKACRKRFLQALSKH